MQDRICPSIYGVELEIAIFIMVMNHTCVYGYGRVHHILDEPRNARTGDGSNTALGEIQWDQSYTWPCTRVAKIGIYSMSMLKYGSHLSNGLTIP